MKTGTHTHIERWIDKQGELEWRQRYINKDREADRQWERHTHGGIETEKKRERIREVKREKDGYTQNDRDTDEVREKERRKFSLTCVFDSSPMESAYITQLK